MDTITITPELQAARLKAVAEMKLAQARVLLLEALEDMSRLEGTGYCKVYEKGRTVEGELLSFSDRFRFLKPPTGVFTV